MFKRWFKKSQTDEGRQLSVLMVSDDADSASMVSAALVAEGCMVKSVTTTAEALQLMDQPPLPDVLIGDFRTPDTDGKALLVQGRARLGTRKLPPVLFLMDGRDDEDSARQYGANELLIKPIDGAALIKMISKMAGGNGAPPPG